MGLVLMKMGCKSPITHSEPNEAITDSEEVMDRTGEVHMIICGIDYSCDTATWAGQNPLDTKFAYDMMLQLAQQCGVSTLQCLWNQEVTKENVANVIGQVGEKCGPDDYFIFYYTGHGDRLTDDDGDEESGMDSALCFVGPDGNAEPRGEVWWRDDDFAATVCGALTPDVKVLVLVDCCHCESIMDFKQDSSWADRMQQAISISGCEDEETSAGTGKGGMFTRAMTAAIQWLQENGEEDGYMVSALYNRTLEEYEARKLPGHRQNITVHGCAIRPQDLPWPLVPQGQYVSPANTYLRGLPMR
mmetsp:Transcript_105823/g.294533  ORF Transcript_105823/g.294533 Transcript_105823/m.294533 type:complete len:302 (+) Transcript_105823:64-969(+)